MQQIGFFERNLGVEKGIAAGLLVLIATIGFLIIAPPAVEGSKNVVAPSGTQRAQVAAERSREQARTGVASLHARLQVVDLHADTLLWKRDLVVAANRGHVDLPRLLAGNVALQIFSSMTKSPKNLNYDRNSGDTDNITALAIAQLQPRRTWTSLLERSLWHAEKLRRAEAASQGQLRIIRTGHDVRSLLSLRAARQRVVGAMLSVEGLHNLEGKAENLDRLYAAGFRMAGLAHFFDNEVAGSMHGMNKGGLTPLGRQIVREMEAKGMIVDIAHSSHRAVAEILAMATRPVVSSHGGVQATCKVNRNLSDEEIRGVARTGGVIGIGYWEGAVCGTSPEAVAKAIAHVRDLVGISHVGLGSDFDGSVTTSFDTSELALVTQALVKRGFSDHEIRAVMGGNALRLITWGLEPKPRR